MKEHTHLSLPTLYKKSAKTDAVQQWSVETTDNTIFVTQGQVDGKMQTYETVCEGKNIGRSNETSSTQQAQLEAKSKWEKQKKKGYVEDPSGESELKLPMKVSVYQDNRGKVQFPCTVSPKLNGVNAEARLLDNNEIILLSRGGEEYTLPEHWREELLQMFEELGVDSLNGEVYKHGEWLQDITGAIKKHRPLTDELEFHVFDLPTHGGTWREREEILDDELLKIVEHHTFFKEFVFPVSSEEVNSHEKIENLHKMYVDAGYEGIIIRNYDGLYEYNTRSNVVFKMKVPLSEEFLITGYSKDKYGHPVFELDSKGGTFKAKPKGTSEQRLAIMNEADSWIGRWMTAEFESYSKGGKPTKPVGIGLREGYYDDKLGKFVPTV